MAVVGWQLGATVQAVSFFYFTVLRFRCCGVSYRFGLLPLGGSVKFNTGDEKPQKTKSDWVDLAADKEPPGFNDLHPLRRILVSASGCAALFLLAAVCLGPLAAARSLGRGFLQVIPYAPWASPWVPSGRELASRFASLLAQGPFSLVLGVLAAKWAAFNLLPVPPLNGGMILLTLAGWRNGLSDRVVTTLTGVGLCTALLLCGYWFVQFGWLGWDMLHGPGIGAPFWVVAAIIGAALLCAVLALSGGDGDEDPGGKAPETRAPEAQVSRSLDEAIDE
jgi:membrane-associated protease RseP (regulator of RpoE activity)